MSKTFDQGKEEVATLCQYFATNRQAFLARNEAQVRQLLIDPLFEALGWDVHNKARTAPQYQEVIPEDSLDVEGHQKAPDYTFRAGPLPKFFAEAKKCGVNISADPGPAFQLRRYGFSGKLALSILTDFEELGVYDCTIRPHPSDKASHARIQYLRFDEYPDRWRELWNVFSREAVWSGAFDQYAASKRKRGSSEVDVEFLKDIEGWRDALAGNIALRNKDLSLDDLNAAVQLTIDRVVFLRMAEDRGLESYGQLLKLCERPDIYPRFMRDLCRRADQKYNSGLFHFQKESGVSEDPDRITPKLTVDDRVFKPILQGLYFEHGSPYHFGVLPVEILGTVYERFLGKVIRLTAGHQAKPEEKPEVRKAGGVYYTPAYIVEYIVKHTVGRQIEGQSPAQLAGYKDRPPFRVLDMACGSGSFLLGAYQCLLDYCLKWYIEHRPETCKKAVYKDPRSGQWRLTIEEKKRILTSHIFGVDIDPQAVEVTKLSLLLKVLEGETEQSLSLGLLPFSDRALPNLADNIKCGNSLIAPDCFTGKLIADPEEMKRVNPFDWSQGFPEAMKAGGFDCIIGNPPYIRIQMMKEWAPLEVEIYKELFRAGRTGNYDIYVVFVEQGLQLLNPSGQLGFILPSKFFATDYGAALRDIIGRGRSLRKVVDFGHAQVFDGASNYTCLLFLSRTPVLAGRYSRTDYPNTLSTADLEQTLFESESITSAPWSFSGKQERSIAENICRLSVPLGQLPARIARGSSSGNDDVFMLSRRGRDLITRNGQRVDVERSILRTPVYASDFGRYRFAPSSGELIIFPYDVCASGYELKPEAIMKRDFPKAYSYLLERKKELEGRKQFKAWYGFSAPRNLEVHDSAHFFVPLLANQGLYCRLPETARHLCLMASGGFSITVSPSCGLSANYVLGLLNSKLLFWRLRSISNVFRGGWVTCTKQYVETLPIRAIDFSRRPEKAAHDRVVTLVDSMLGLQEQLAPANSVAQKAIIQRQIDATEAEIDRLVYDLYGLTAEEIAIVEGKGQ
jgi:predicted type IV restriction endonuclease